MPALGLAEGELARGRVLRPGVWHVRSIHQPQVRSSGDGPDGYRVLDEAPLADFCMRAKGYQRSHRTAAVSTMGFTFLYPGNNRPFFA